MSLLVTVLVVLVVMALALYCVRLAPLDGTVSQIVQIVIVAIALLYIVQASGLLR